VLVRWSPPPVGCVKLNTDGSCRDDGHICCGGIIWESDIEWLGGFSKYVGIRNAYLGELWGVLEGLKYARMLHVDFQVVVQALILNSYASWRESL
jgi:ribonuclease HI